MACNCLCRPLLSNLLKSMLLLLQLLDFDSEVSAARNKRKEALFYSIESASHVGNIIKVEKTKSGLDCAFLCLQMPQGSCLSFNFGRIAINGLHICELSNSERALEPHKLLNRTNFVYYGMKMSVSIIFKGERSFFFLQYYPRNIIISVQKKYSQKYTDKNFRTWPIFVVKM